ncbi:MAG TPA: hypothetical protein PKA60_02940 [Candidatus Paceibacterota bacterium]|nr:hypothetical protein [Candidatus Paceibacterota bacterium]
MSSQILEKIFGGESRLKIMKLFIFNTDVFFDKDSIAKKTRLNPDIIQKEIKFFQEIKLIKSSSTIMDFETKKGTKKKRVSGFVLNKNFSYLNSLKSILINTIPLQKNNIAKKMSKIGSVKLIVLSGVFLQIDEGAIDLLVVIDNAKDSSIKNTINQIESEIGKEIRYAVFSSDDFKYRLGLYDHLLRDIFDYPHHVLVDKIGL